MKPRLSKIDTWIQSFQSTFCLYILTAKEKSISYEKPRQTGKSYLEITERLSREKEISKELSDLQRAKRRYSINRV